MSSFDELIKRAKVALVWGIYRGLPLALLVAAFFGLLAYFAGHIGWRQFDGWHDGYTQFVLATPLLVAIFGFVRGRTPYGEGFDEL